MKNYILLLLVALICCKSESKSSNEINNPAKIQAAETISDTGNENDLATVTRKTFTAEERNSNDNFSQKLSVTWVSDNIVEYTLVFNNKSCSKTIGGRATGIKPKKDPFMNSYKGASFEVTKYEDSNRSYTVELRIDTANKDKAVVEVSFNESGENENCEPRDVVMLEQK